MAGRRLVVEDDSGIVHAVSAYLQREGFDVDVATGLSG